MAVRDCKLSTTLSAIALQLTLKVTIGNPKELSIFPLPFSDIINIQHSFSNELNIEMEILDMAGKVVYKKKVINENKESLISVNLSNLSSGVYVCKLLCNNQISVAKITKN